MLCLAGVAHAYDKKAVEDVKARTLAKPEQGAYLGGFILKPELGFLQTYDDNIYSKAEDKRGDMVSTLKPSAKLTSNWNLHQIELGASSSINRFNRTSSENSEDYAVYISGRADLDYETYLTGQFKTEWKHEARSSLDDPDGDKPIGFRQDTGVVGFTRALGILQLFSEATFRSYTYDEGQQSGIVISNADRNRNHNSLRTRLAYSVSDNAQAFVQLTYDRRRYDLDSEADRNSDGYDWRFGAMANLSGKAKGEIFAGYLKTKFDSRTYRDIGVPTFGGSLLWNVSQLTSFKFGLERQSLETSLDGASGVVRTGLDMALQHSITPDILAELGFSMDHDTYKGDSSSNADRDNTTYRGGLGVSYQFGDGYTAKLAYDYIRREFKADTEDYDNNRVTASVVYVY